MALLVEWFLFNRGRTDVMGRVAVKDSDQQGGKKAKATSATKRSGKKATITNKTTVRKAAASRKAVRSVEDFQTFISTRIRDLRLDQELSQKQLAAKSGIDQAQISQLENNRTSPKMTTFFKLARALEVQPNDFFSNLWGSEINNDPKDTNIDFVARELARKIKLRTRNNGKASEIWKEFEQSEGKNTPLLARLLVNVFFAPQFKRSLNDAVKLPDYQKFLIGELIGLMMSDEVSKKHLTQLERAIP